MDAVAGALADPIRRSILMMLQNGGATAGFIAEQFAVSRPAVSRHLRVLREAKLVEDVASGREREYQLKLDSLRELELFLKTLRQPTAAAWEQRFDALATEVARVRKRRRGQANKNTKRRTA